MVLCHGYGADGNDLIALAGAIAPLLPDAAFVAPHAPEPMPGVPEGRQWFGLARVDPRELQAGAARAVPDLQHFIDRELVRSGVAPEALALIGFSQGTMMALAAGLSRDPSPVAILGFSGALVAPVRSPKPPPVFLIHGDNDSVLPVEATYAAFETLAASGVPVMFHTRPGLAHGIDELGLAAGARFLKDALDGRLQSAQGPMPVHAKGEAKFA